MTLPLTAEFLSSLVKYQEIVALESARDALGKENAGAIKFVVNMGQNHEAGTGETSTCGAHEQIPPFLSLPQTRVVCAFTVLTLRGLVLPFLPFRKRYQETDTRDKKRNEELTEEFRRITKQYNDMQAKFRHFEISDNNRYEQVCTSVPYVIYPSIRVSTPSTLL